MSHNGNSLGLDDCAVAFSFNNNRSTHDIFKQLQMHRAQRSSPQSQKCSFWGPNRILLRMKSVRLNFNNIQQRSWLYGQRSNLFMSSLITSHDSLNLLLLGYFKCSVCLVFGLWLVVLSKITTLYSSPVTDPFDHWIYLFVFVFSLSRLRFHDHEPKHNNNNPNKVLNLLRLFARFFSSCVSS